MAAVFGRVSQLQLVAARDNDKASVCVSELAAVVASASPLTRYTFVSELAAIAVSLSEKNMTAVSEIAAVVAYVTGGTEKFNSRGWGFTLDQHQFYVLHLGNQGTVVYDVLSQEWAEWQTEGYVGWNAEHGIEWNDEVYFGDISLPTLWKMSLESDLDEDFRTITRVVTGGIPATGRTAIGTGMFTLSATPQATLISDGDDVPFIVLSISDNGGKLFRDRNTILVDGNETQDLSWKGLGMIKAPGRIFKITDTGGFIRIDGADQKLDGE